MRIPSSTHFPHVCASTAPDKVTTCARICARHLRPNDTDLCILFDPDAFLLPTGLQLHIRFAPLRSPQFLLSFANWPVKPAGAWMFASLFLCQGLSMLTCTLILHTAAFTCSVLLMLLSVLCCRPTLPQSFSKDLMCSCHTGISHQFLTSYNSSSFAHACTPPKGQLSSNHHATLHSQCCMQG